MVNITRVLTIASFAAGIFAVAPLSEHEHTETVLAQEIGTMTQDGMLVYEMNHCMVTMTTNCEVSLSTGPPAIDTPPAGGVSTPGEPGGDYPVPTGEPDVPGEPTDGEPGQPGEPTEGEPTGTDAQPTPTDTGATTASVTGDQPTPTDDDATGTNTETAATGTMTAGAVVLEAGVLGLGAAVLAVYL